MTGRGGGYLKKIVFDHVTFIKVKFKHAEKFSHTLYNITAIYDLKPSNNKGDI